MTFPTRLASAKLKPSQMYRRHGDKRFHEKTPVNDSLSTWYLTPMRKGEPVDPLVLSVSEWKRGASRLRTSFEWADYPGGGEGPQYHFVISYAGKRSQSLKVGPLMRALGVGSSSVWRETPDPRAHHFWVAVDPAHRTASVVATVLGPRYHIPCPCVACDVAPLVGKRCLIHEAKP